MLIDFYLKDTVTGKEGVHSESYDDLYLARYMWSEGNYACDCNRLLFLDSWDDDTPCSRDRVTLMKAVVRDAGRVICENEVWKLEPQRRAYP